MAIIDKPSDYFNTVLWTGNGSARSITGVGFQPDLVWGKNRGNDDNDWLIDSVRGTTKRITPNGTSAEGTISTLLTSFDSDGFSLGTSAALNASGVTAVGWNWKAGGTAVSNTDGSITSSVSANQDAGFSIVSWTGNGSNGATIGHGLGATPAIVITKRRSAVGDWLVGGSTINTVGGGSNKLLLLNTTAAIDTNSEVYQTFSSTTFQVGVNAYANTSGSTMISYCFAEKQGYSKFGSYTGNGSTDGTFVYLGFKPAFVLIKRTDSTGEWELLDNKRNTYNPAINLLEPNNSAADGINSTHAIDFLSNGFKHRNTRAPTNASGGSYIYMALAENPFVSSTGVPATAR